MPEQEHEYTATLPKQYREPSQEPELTIGISAHGGGTVGERYANNGWSYSVYRDGTELISGADLRSGGTGGTHESMARTLAAFLSADAESLEYLQRTGYTEDPERLAVYDDTARELLTAESERFGLFGMEPEPEHEAGE